MNPDVAGLPSKRLSAMGWANAVDTKMDFEARAESINLRLRLNQLESDMGSGILRI